LKQITGQIEKGEGMIGRMVQDDGLYQQVNGLVTEVRAALDDFRETTPVVTFASIFFGAF